MLRRAAAVTLHHVPGLVFRVAGTSKSFSALVEVAFRSFLAGKIGLEFGEVELLRSYRSSLKWSALSEPATAFNSVFHEAPHHSGGLACDTSVLSAGFSCLPERFLFLFWRSQAL